MGTHDADDASHPGSPAGAAQMSEETVTRLLRTASPLPCPDNVRSRLRTTIAAEIELRRAIRVEPDVAPEVKPRSALWSEHVVHDD